MRVLHLFALAVATFGGLLDAQYVVHERKESRISGTQGRRLERDAILPMRIGLKQTSLEQGHASLLEISNPSSPNYGKHWTADEVATKFAPSEESFRSVKAWLVSNGLNADNIQHNAKGWVALDLAAEKAEHLLSTEYFEFHNEKGEVRLGCHEYSLPETVAEHVDYVVPGVTLSPVLQKSKVVKRDARPTPQHHHQPWTPWSQNQSYHVPPAAQQLPPDLQTCGRNITPACIRALYDIPLPHLNDSVNSLGIFESTNYYSQSDLNAFFTKYAPFVPNGTHPILDSINQTITTETLAESNIDLDLAYALIYPQTVTLYQTTRNYGNTTLSGNTAFAPFIESTANLLYALDGSYCNSTDRAYGVDCGEYSPTRVISMSYDQVELESTLAFQQRQCNEIMKLSLQGTTFVVSSGDYGVAGQLGALSNGCYLPANHSASEWSNGTVFAPNYFINCPYVLSVGATQLNDNETVLDPESAMFIPNYAQTKGEFASSGGFANYFPRPAYQDAAVGTYFAKHDPGYPYYVWNGIDAMQNGSNIGADGGLYNRAGRGLPDVSANGVGLGVFVNGTEIPEYGTSLSAPIWASVITLINEERTAVGKGPVGFVNPVLYQHPEVMNDITNGSNPGCGTNGFEAVEGWDPVTGLGTPNYPKLLELFLSLP